VIDAVDAELDDFRIDFAATDKKRAWISDNRHKWLEEDPATIAAAYKKGEVDMLDVIRRHGVILDWGTGELFETTTAQYRELMARRSSSHWG
jgi:N-methylhydantoinase B